MSVRAQATSPSAWRVCCATCTGTERCATHARFCIPACAHARQQVLGIDVTDALASLGTRNLGAAAIVVCFIMMAMMMMGQLCRVQSYPHADSGYTAQLWGGEMAGGGGGRTVYTNSF